MSTHTLPRNGYTTHQKIIPSLQAPDHLAEVQAAYGASCTRYEGRADKRLKGSGTIIVSGYGCALRVKNNALAVFPGKTHAKQAQRTALLYRGVHGCQQIMLLSDKGMVSLGAMQFCCEQDISVTLMDSRGKLLQSLTAENRANATLRRKQYLLHENGKAGHIASALVKRKIAAQLATLEHHTELPNKRTNALETLKDGLEWFNVPTLPPYLRDIAYLRTYEGRLATVYFETWHGLPIRWAKTDSKTVPPHWKQVTERTSPLSHNHGARWATCPLHAVLNYAYAILESQCRQALNSHGFDVACGLLHADKLYRDSLVYNLMEGHRPSVDHLVLQLVSRIILHKGDLMQEKEGTIKFNPQFARYIAASCRLPQKDIDESARWLQEEVMS